MMPELSWNGDPWNGDPWNGTDRKVSESKQSSMSHVPIPHPDATTMNEPWSYGGAVIGQAHVSNQIHPRVLFFFF